MVLEALVTAVPGLDTYAAKFLLGDALELLNIASQCGHGLGQLSLQVNSPTGPALAKVTHHRRLFLLHGRQMAISTAERMALCMARYIFFRIFGAWTGTAPEHLDQDVGDRVDNALSSIHSLLETRHRVWPDKQALPDLQDIQCRLCGFCITTVSESFLHAWNSVSVTPHVGHKRN